MATNERFVAASRQRVFAVLADGWTYSNWVVGTSHMRAVERDWPAVGSRLFHAAGSWPVTTRDETVVTEMVPDERLALTARGRPLGEARVVVDLADAPGGCSVTLYETPVAGPGKWLHNPLAEKMLVRRNTESLDRLAAVAEQRTVPSE